MTIRTILVTPEKANKVLKDKFGHAFRSEKEYFKEGDIITLRVVKKQKTVLHSVDKHTYIVTTVLDCMNAPLEKGYQFIEYREVA